jgi:hypothetical protein
MRKKERVYVGKMGRTDHAAMQTAGALNVSTRFGTFEV